MHVTYNILALNGFRTVVESSLIVYQNANYHPDRVLPFHDLIFVTGGYFDLYQEGERIRALSGDIAFLSANKHHYPAQISPALTQCCFIHFTSIDGDSLSTNIPGNIADNQVCIPSHFRVPDSERVLKMFRIISSTYYSENEYKNKLNHAYLQQLLTEIHIQCSHNVTIFDDNITRYIIDAINDNLHNNLTIDQLARKLGYAPRTLHQHFKRTMGLTIHQYQLKVKLNIIKTIIQETPDITLGEIALSYGFYDEYHLSKCFKKFFHVSPLQFKTQSNTKTIEVP